MHHNVCVCIHKSEIQKCMDLCVMCLCTEVTVVWMVCFNLLHCIVRTWDLIAHPLKEIHLYKWPSSSKPWITSLPSNPSQEVTHTRTHTHTHTHSHTHKQTHTGFRLWLSMWLNPHTLFLIMYQTPSNFALRHHGFVGASLLPDWSIFFAGGGVEQLSSTVYSRQGGVITICGVLRCPLQHVHTATQVLTNDERWHDYGSHTQRGKPLSCYGAKPGHN